MSTRRLHEHLEYLARRLQHDWRRRGFHLSADISYLVDRMEFRLDVLLDGADLHYILTRDELEMDGGSAVQHCLRMADLDIERHLRNTLTRDESPPSVAVQNMTAFMVQYAQEMERLMADSGFMKPHSEAMDKAKELFKATAGEEAFKTLDSGKPLPIKGSNGTDYTLHKRSTYCIERPSDGVCLCAVVPEVPLWDHLLGIKLMVENDEPMFLKTANVSGGVNMPPGGITWFEPRTEQERQEWLLAITQRVVDPPVIEPVPDRHWMTRFLYR